MRQLVNERDYFGLPKISKHTRSCALEFCTNVLKLDDARFALVLAERGGEIRHFMRYLSSLEKEKLEERIIALDALLQLVFNHEKTDIIREILYYQKLRIREHFKHIF